MARKCIAAERRHHEKGLAPILSCMPLNYAGLLIASGRHKQALVVLTDAKMTLDDELDRRKSADETHDQACRKIASRLVGVHYNAGLAQRHLRWLLEAEENFRIAAQIARWHLGESHPLTVKAVEAAGDVAPEDGAEAASAPLAAGEEGDSKKVTLPSVHQAARRGLDVELSVLPNQLLNRQPWRLSKVSRNEDAFLQDDKGSLMPSIKFRATCKSLAAQAELKSWPKMYEAGSARGPRSRRKCTRHHGRTSKRAIVDTARSRDLSDVSRVGSSFWQQQVFGEQPQLFYDE